MSQGRTVGRIGGEVLLAFAGTKGIDKIAKVAKGSQTLAKAANAVKMVTGGKSAGGLNINLQLFGKKIHPDSSVKEILKYKKGSIKNAPIEKGGPSWDDIRNMSMDEINKKAQKGITGFKTIRKLLTDKRFDK